MMSTKITHKFARGAGLAVCVTALAWCQSAPTFKGRGLPLNGLRGTQAATPAAVTAASAQYRFVSIPVPGTAGVAQAEAYGINNSGLVVGTYNNSSTDSNGFVWWEGTLQTLNKPGALYTGVSAVSNRGDIVGFYGDSIGAHATVYSYLDGTWTSLPDISGTPLNEANGGNDSGFLVGEGGQGNNFNYPGKPASWIWNPRGQSYSFFAVPGSASHTTQPSSINDKQQVVGIFNDKSGTEHGFLKDGVTYTTVDLPGAMGTYPYGINNNGTMVGWWANLSGWSEGFVRTSDGTFTVVNFPGGLETIIGAINDRGDICGSWVDPVTGVWTAFIGYKQ